MSTPLVQPASEKTMPSKPYKKWIGICAASLFVLTLGPWLYVKLEVSRNTTVYDSVWSDTGACRIDSYISRYSRFGVLGRLVALFSSNGFYRVYNKAGDELKSSEWLLWQREYPDMEAAHWVNGHAIYPTGDGYRGWTLPACG